MVKTWCFGREPINFVCHNAQGEPSIKRVLIWSLSFLRAFPPESIGYVCLCRLFLKEIQQTAKLQNLICDMHCTFQLQTISILELMDYQQSIFNETTYAMKQLYSHYIFSNKKFS